MLKINLLPRYVYERREIRQAAFLCVLAFVLVLACMVTWWIMLGRRESSLTGRVAEMEQRADQVKALKQVVQAEEAKIPPIQAKVDFIEGVMDYNTRCPKLYEDLAKYTYSRVLYRTMETSGNQLTIKAYSRSHGDCGRFLLNLYRAGHILSSVSISGVPGYRAGNGQSARPVSFSGTATDRSDQMSGLPKGFEFTVTCTLVEPIVAPTYGAAAAEEVPTGLPEEVPPPEIGPPPMPVEEEVGPPPPSID